MNTAIFLELYSLLFLVFPFVGLQDSCLKGRGRMLACGDDEKTGELFNYGAKGVLVQG